MRRTEYMALAGLCKGCGKVKTYNDAYTVSKDGKHVGNALNSDGYCRKCRKEIKDA